MVTITIKNTTISALTFKKLKVDGMRLAAGETKTLKNNFSDFWSFSPDSAYQEIISLGTSGDLEISYNQQIVPSGLVDRLFCAPLVKEQFYDSTIKVNSVNDLLARFGHTNNVIQIPENSTIEFDTKLFDWGVYSAKCQGNLHIQSKSQLNNKQIFKGLNKPLYEVNGSFFVSKVQVELESNTSSFLKLNGNGTQSVQIVDCNFFGANTNLGHLNALRQFFGTGILISGIRNGFLCEGTWDSGITLKDSRVNGFVDYLFKSHTNGVSLRNVRSNVNATMPAGSFLFDFSNQNQIRNDASFQIQGGFFDGDGAIAKNFSDSTSINIEGNVKCKFKNNTGSKKLNTYIGAVSKIQSAPTTTLPNQNDIVRLAGVWVFENLQHFQDSGDGYAYYEGEEPLDCKLSGKIKLEGGGNDLITLHVRKINRLTDAETDIGTVVERISNSQGGFDFGSFEPRFNITLLQNEGVVFYVANNTDSTDVQAQESSKIFLEEKI